MNYSDLEIVWNDHSEDMTFSINANAVMQSVKQTYRRSRKKMIFYWSIAIGISSAAFVIFFGTHVFNVIYNYPQKWMITLLIFESIVWIAFFAVYARLYSIQKKKSLKYGETLLECIRKSISLVKFRIWLMKDFRWFPVTIFALIVIYEVIYIGIKELSMNEGVPLFLLIGASTVWVLILSAILIFILKYRINKHENPRLKELQSLEEMLSE